MFRSFSIVVLGAIVFAVSPVDAQLFRRLLPQTNYGQSYQRQQQPDAGYGQTSADCACQPQTQQLTQQQLLAQQSQPGNYRAASSYNQQAYLAQQQRLARQNAARPNSAAGQQTPVQRQPVQQQPVQQQRYAVYYNPRTNQTILRPIGPAVAQTANTTGLRNRFRQPAAQPTVQPTVQGQAYVTPAATRSQFDIARQPVAPQPQISDLSLNPPQPTAAVSVEAPNPVVSTSFIEAATPAPAGVLTASPVADPATKPEPASPTKAFSILESGDSAEPGELKLNQDGPEANSN